jgi:hypothetical protein
MFAFALLTRDAGIGFAHAAECIEMGAAVQADIFIKGHRLPHGNSIILILSRPGYKVNPNA